MKRSRGGIVAQFGKVMPLAAIVLISAYAPEVVGQLQMPTQSPQGGNPMAPQSQKNSITLNGILFSVKQLVRNKKQNTLRVVLEATETQDKGRLVGFVQPQATMIDNMGNQWLAVKSSGVRICTVNKAWDEVPRLCRPRQRSGSDLTKLTPKVPKIAVIEFAPGDGSVIDSTLSSATNATLNARLVIASGGGVKEWSTADLTMAGIVLPR